MSSNSTSTKIFQKAMHKWWSPKHVSLDIIMSCKYDISMFKLKLALLLTYKRKSPYFKKRTPKWEIYYGEEPGHKRKYFIFIFLNCLQPSNSIIYYCSVFFFQCRAQTPRFWYKLAYLAAEQFVHKINLFLLENWISSTCEIHRLKIPPHPRNKKDETKRH